MNRCQMHQTYSRATARPYRRGFSFVKSILPPQNQHQHGESTREVLAEILPDAEASGELDKLEESGVVSQLRLGEPKL